MKLPTWNSTIRVARHERWVAGLAKYRKQPNDDFVGDPVVELYEELLDALNYLDECERQGVSEIGGAPTHEISATIGSVATVVRNHLRLLAKESR